MRSNWMLGLAGAAIAYVAQEAVVCADLRESADNLAGERRKLREELHRLANEGGAAEDATALRTLARSRANSSAGLGKAPSAEANRW